MTEVEGHTSTDKEINEFDCKVKPRGMPVLYNTPEEYKEHLGNYSRKIFEESRGDYRTN